MEGWTDAGAPRGLLTRKAAPGSRILETEGRTASAAEVEDNTTKPLSQKYWEEEKEHGNLEELACVRSAANEPR